jgi:hypothetical protein
MTSNTIRVNVIEKIQEEIRHRYSETSIIKSAIDNDVITGLGKSFKLLKRHDTYMNPNLLILNPELTSTFPISYNGNKNKTIYFNDIVKKYCMDVVGYDPTTPEGKERVRELLDNIAKKKLKLAVIGYGGAMINFLWNTYLLAFISSYNEPIFEEITIYEKESISLTNILRLSKPIILDSFLSIHCNDDGSLPKIRLIKEEFQLTKKMVLFKRFLTEESEVKALEKEGYVFIGAPNFAARQLLENSPFFFLGHANNELEIFYQPLVNTDLTFESYGSIDVPVLLSNLAVGTIKQLELFLEVDTSKKKSSTNFEKSQSLFKVDYGVLYNLTESETVQEDNETQTSDGESW